MSFEGEGNQIKEEKCAITENEAPAPTTATIETGSEPTTTTVEIEETKPVPVETTTTTKTARSRAHYFNVQFQQKSKILRDMWAQHRMQLNKDQSQLLIILLLSFLALVCSVAALSSNSWTCNSQKGVSFGLWNTCYMPLRHTTEGWNTTATTVGDVYTINTTNTTNWVPGNTKNVQGILCAHQGLNEVSIQYAEQSHIDQITASQGLIISGAVLYVLSIVMLMLAYKFIQLNNLNSVRNALVTSMCVQIVSFCLQLVGFFLFILTDRLAGSISVLFIYFGLAIFVTNGINFYTVEYKTFKARSLAI